MIVHGWIANKELLLFHAIPRALSVETACGLPIFEIGPTAPLGTETVTKLSLSRHDEPCSVCEAEVRADRGLISGHIVDRHMWRPSDGR